MMTVVLHWTEKLAENVGRYATYNSLHEALEQAVADDGMTAARITDESGDEVLANKARIAEYAAAKRQLEEKRDAAIAKAHDAHQAALVSAVG
jgi:hypothetical protein